ncbi:hypothetical protein [Streptomyces sp. DH10]|uniref:hypothetical protein n=1 Tax=Streptomyces sp. DH10 TaxID=3040121 RepID=UPI0024418B88|nr:hypothetical protein [Streptomyces sp. DH10]MDG9710358.1 hypothetical protein [Streptomyces sp. DH10]
MLPPPACAAVVDTYWGTGTTKLMVVNIWKCGAGTTPGGTCLIDQQDNDTADSSRPGWAS